MKYEVYIKSGNKYIIPNQSVQDLTTVMRAVYLINAKFTNTPVKEQINELNNIVIGNLTPNIISSIKMKLEYLRIINNPIEPMERPKNVSKTGTKTLPSITKMF